MLPRDEEKGEEDQSLNAMWDEQDDINFELLCNMSTVSTLMKLILCMLSLTRHYLPGVPLT